MQTYKIEYSRSPYDMWNSLKTLPPVDKEGHDSLFEFSKKTSRYHFDENANDLELLDTDTPPVIPVCRFDGNWDEAVAELCSNTQPATFGFRATKRKNLNNEWEENDFRKWGYDIDGGYTIANRMFKPQFEKGWNEALQHILDCFGFEKPGQVKFDVQMPGQCFYWHLDAFGGVLQSKRGDFDNAAETDLDQRQVMRTMIFLDDQRLGQVWQQGNLFINWQRGDCITWPWRDIPHGTCNYGHSPRPVLNITGTLTKKSWEFLQDVSRR